MSELMLGGPGGLAGAVEMILEKGLVINADNGGIRVEEWLLIEEDCPICGWVSSQRRKVLEHVV